ncbi:homocysteine S-methyltransferase family protein [Salinivibrio sp. EAGSL]|uniref:homocysteine S-methyltransferase family protein n=1 Tax=Salinivibrio sp. EAGSL TaxID=2738468 RepID=UPI00158A8F45|nr:homocysteine S-methyltransferase family protein [Salinivibrio sp. EAGSL]NUY57322.1 homocysteine S-methyltransferase family protein [Salinivibrio sp. EAGSL]
MTSIALLDGGLGQEIYQRGPDVSSKLWSVAVMLKHANIVKDVHKDFIRAGAKTHTLNTYPATPTRLAKAGLSDKINTIYQKAFEALQQAVDETGADVDIAGCLPPLVGSYLGQPQRSFDDMKAEFLHIARLQPHVDVFLIETMTNTLEARAACAAAQEQGKPYGVAFRLEAAGTLRSGESLEQAMHAVAEYAPTAVMLNCCDPAVLTTAMPQMATQANIVGGYANAFKSVEDMAKGSKADALEAREDLSPLVHTERVQQWIADGALVVGGCCEITPAHIQHLAQTLEQSHEIIKFSQLGG